MWKFMLQIGLSSDPYICIPCIINTAKENVVCRRLDGYDVSSNFIFDFMLIYNKKTKVRIKRIEVPVGRLNYMILTNDHHILQDQEMKITYTAFKYHEDGEQLGQIFINTISHSFDLKTFLFRSNDQQYHCVINNKFHLGPINSKHNIWQSSPVLLDHHHQDTLQQQLHFINEEEVMVDYQIMFKKEDDEEEGNTNWLPHCINDGEESVVISLYKFEQLPPTSFHTTFTANEFVATAANKNRMLKRRFSVRYRGDDDDDYSVNTIEHTLNERLSVMLMYRNKKILAIKLIVVVV